MADEIDRLCEETAHKILPLPMDRQRRDEIAYGLKQLARAILKAAAGKA